MAKKTVVGYCEPFSVRPGGVVELFTSCDPDVIGDCSLDLVRLRCGDPFTGLDEEVVEADLPATVAARHQPLRPGSHAVAPRHEAVDGMATLHLRVRARPTLPGGGREQALVATYEEGTGAGWSLELDGEGRPRLRVGDALVALQAPLRRDRWVELEASYEADGRLSLTVRHLPTRGPGDAVADRDQSGVVDAGPGRLRPGGPLLFAARWGADGRPGAHFDGRLEAPELLGVASWDFATGIGTSVLRDVGPLGIDAHTVQCPARAVTGSRWDGSTQRWSDDPSQWAAVHFHHDDLVDAGWEADATLAVPPLPSGIYCFRLTSPAGDVDRTPFVVRPPAGERTSDVAFLVPSATYLAYANHRMTIDGSDFFPARNRLRPEFQWIKDHDEVGLSMYEYHPDGSGVIYSSRRRPILNLKPGADGWAFTADTNIAAFLERSGLGYDCLTDEDLHWEGGEALEGYRVVVTGSHPEYTSTRMLDALEGYLQRGGRLMYLGGNGFYWRVAFSEHQPGVMEVRRAEDGTRGWIAEPGEYHHEWGGEYGGLWRRLGRAPNLLVGIGFAAQGFDRAAPFVRSEASWSSRAAWVFEGVEGPELFGDYGVGGGAAGQEIDRYDPRLGSPPHAVVLASATEHSELMLRTKEELLATRPPYKDPKVRADIVFFETPAGGAVFSVGSIAWFGALPHDGWDNDVARVTSNVLRRFADATPFHPPT